MKTIDMSVVFEDYFNKSGGKPFVYNGVEVRLSDEIKLPSSKIKLQLTFMSTDSEWKQGILLKTKGAFEVDNQKLSDKVVFWEHTAPKQFEIIIETKDKVLSVYNVWDIGDGTMNYGHNGAALYVEQTNLGTLYHCNDGHPDDDFNELVFKVKYSTVLGY